MGIIAVTGAASGIGAAIIDRLKREGTETLGIDVQPTDIIADLGTAKGREDAVRQIRERAPNGLDGLVSGAALGPYCEPEAVMRVNYFGAIAILDELKDCLAQGQEPAAVAISSIGAIYADILPETDVPECIEACLAGDEEMAVAAIRGHDGTTSYSVAKRALAYAVRARAMDWGSAGVRLNAVAPGSTETPMFDKLMADEAIGGAVSAMPIPLGRTAPPEELANVVCFLLGSDSRFVHGAVLHADGGSDSVVRPRSL